MSNAELTVALVKARQEMRGTVYKAGRNDAQRFAYVGHEHVLVSGARDALLKHGLALVQTGVEFAGESTYRTSKGDNACWRWRGKFTLAHTSGGALELTFEATTQANDKAGYVASTALDRTAHLRVLELAGSSEEDPEHNSHDDEPQRRQDTVSSGHDAAAAQMGRDLDVIRDEQTLVQWARTLAAMKFGAQATGMLWRGFGERCKELGLDPHAVAAQARKAA